MMDEVTLIIIRMARDRMWLDMGQSKCMLSPSALSLQQGVRVWCWVAGGEW